MSEFNTVMVVVAHPDDEVLGCGGTLAGFAARNKAVHVLMLGGVTTSRYAQHTGEEQWKQEAFQDEAARAAAVLGVASLKRCGLADNRFDAVPLLELIKPVEEMKQKLQPELILTHDVTDLNVDHRLVHQAVMTAFRPVPGSRCRRIMTFETLSSTEWQDSALATFAPNCYSPIAEFIDTKIRALECYKSELLEFPHPRSIQGVTVLAQKRGMEAGVQFAEAFRIVRDFL